jgi:hypothetical protein
MTWIKAKTINSDKQQSRKTSWQLFGLMVLPGQRLWPQIVYFVRMLD